jgi:hypothetical protein
MDFASLNSLCSLPLVLLLTLVRISSLIGVCHRNGTTLRHRAIYGINHLLADLLAEMDGSNENLYAAVIRRLF